MEVKLVKYYSVFVDSTPDISHVDQLTCILWYVLPSGPVQRYLAFLNIQRYTGKELAESLFKFLKAYNIAIVDCGAKACQQSNTCHIPAETTQRL